MTDAPLRKDAARNRAQVLLAARAMLADGLPVRLNAVAQRADVGVGTVYRNFPTPEALVEALAEERFEALTAQATQAAAASDVRPALREFLADALIGYVQDEAFAAAAVHSRPALGRTDTLRRALIDAIAGLAERAVQAGVLRAGISAGDLMALLGGLAYSIRHSGDADARRWLDTLLTGVLNPADSAR